MGCFVIKGEDTAVFLIVLPGGQISYYGNTYYHFGDRITYIYNYIILFVCLFIYVYIVFRNIDSICKIYIVYLKY